MDPFSNQTVEQALTFREAGAWVGDVPRARNQNRVAFVILIGMLTLLAGTFEWSLLAAEGWTLINLLLFALFLLLFTHIAIGFSQAFFGFLILSARSKSRDQLAITQQDFSSLPITAIVMPVFNEDVGAVYARLKVMHDSLKSFGAIEHFQFFVLSDSTDKAIAEMEKLAWAKMAARCGDDRIFYRRRKVAINRKSGNIADFCRRWGSQYRYMICLDADSLMTASTLVELVRRMEANHQIGILQTVPQAINGESIWSRLQQFAMSLYGPIFAAGANFWQQEESNFWGHNAIIRLAPFIQHCALPELPGRNPTGKRPMSHDFVEAALMRRAGWEVHLADDLGGSYEETPPTVVEHLKRDRRWCQGNLQHWSFALAHGFRPVTRFHFLHGIFSFLASPLLMVVLALGFLKNLSGAHLGESIFIDVARARIAFLLFAFTMLLLLVPKLLGIVLALRGERAHRFGGAARMMGSAFLEIIISILMAPVFLFFHAKFVLFTWLGKQVQWHAQQRGCRAGRAGTEALETFSLTTLFGVAAGAITYWLTPGYFFWLLPILAGWILVIPITALISNRSTGMMLRKFRFLLVPSEVKPDEQIRNLRRALRTSSQAPVADAMAATIVHPILQRCFSKIAPDESAELHRQIWSTPAADLSPRWHRELTALEMRAF